MTIHVKDGGVWKESSLYVKDGGTWKTVSEGYIKDAGTWKQFFINRVTVTLTISSNTENYTLNTAKVSGYVAGKTDVILNINSGVTVYSASTGTAALIVDTSWATGDTIRINNSGTILGRGGAGGAGGNAFFNGSNETGRGGDSGGLGLLVQRAISLNNLNRISGGGGGGGGSGAFTTPSFAATGGGGGGGVGNGSGGSAGSGLSNWTPPAAGAGSLTSGGSGSAGALLVNAITCYYNESSYNYSATRGSGGNGGSFGSSGSTASATSVVSSPCPGNYLAGGAGGGGSGGAAISGNSNISYIATGTRNGGIS